MRAGEIPFERFFRVAPPDSAYLRANAVSTSPDRETSILRSVQLLDADAGDFAEGRGDYVPGDHKGLGAIVLDAANKKTEPFLTCAQDRSRSNAFSVSLRRTPPISVLRQFQTPPDRRTSAGACHENFRLQTNSPPTQTASQNQHACRCTSRSRTTARSPEVRSAGCTLAFAD